MKSKTKYDISLEEIQRIFERGKLGKVKSFAPLGAGMYNAVYKVETEGKIYAVKIAPLPDIKTMTYEKNLLNTEVFWYRTMAEKTKINIPEIYTVDMSREIIPSEYFVMDYVGGKTLDKLKKSKEEKDAAERSLCLNIAQIHAVKSDKFGYIQNRLYDTWYDALKSFVENCLADLKAVGKRSKRGEKLLEHVKKHADLLKGVKGCMVNYDIWDLNIVANRTPDGLKLIWIDPERGFYGDPIFDFISINPTRMSLKGKETIDVFNQLSPEKVTADPASEIRFAFALGYLALIQETEKFYRFRPVDVGWWCDVFSSTMYYNRCFKLLRDNA